MFTNVAFLFGSVYKILSLWCKWVTKNVLRLVVFIWIFSKVFDTARSDIIKIQFYVEQYLDTLLSTPVAVCYIGIRIDKEVITL